VCWSGPGRFGPSRKKEAAARRFGNYELWVLNAAMIPDSAVWRQDWGTILSLDAGVNHGCGVVPARKEAVEAARKRRLWWMDTRGARRVGGTSKIRGCSSPMSYQEQPPVDSPRIEVETRSIVRRSASVPGSADSNEWK